MRQFALLLVSTIALVLHVDAQGNRTRIDVSKLGPQVGEQVPDFSLRDQDGRVRDVASIMGRRGAMLVFVRSADW